MRLTPQKLEGWGYSVVKIAQSYFQPFWTGRTVYMTEKQTIA